VSAEIRDLIRRMSQANPLWGAPRIHGELRKLGIAVAQSTVAQADVPLLGHRHLHKSRTNSGESWYGRCQHHPTVTVAGRQLQPQHSIRSPEHRKPGFR
jgi:hypothetical protein